MAHLPEPQFDKYFGNFEFEFWKTKHNESENGLLIKTKGSVDIDNLQGKLQIQNLSQNTLSLGNIENGIVHIFAPECDVELTLKSLHESSYINCRNLKVQITDDFF